MSRARGGDRTPLKKPHKFLLQSKSRKTLRMRKMMGRAESQMKKRAKKNPQKKKMEPSASPKRALPKRVASCRKVLHRP
jgi:hypothetical protein